MKLTMGQAAKQASVSKTTLSRAIKSGKISSEKLSNGSYLIDPAELFRVFPPNSNANQSLVRSSSYSVTPDETAVTPSIALELVRFETENAALKHEIKWLSEQVSDLKEQRDDWKKQASIVKVIADLRPKGGLWSFFKRS